MAHWFNSTVTVFGPRYTIEEFLTKARGEGGKTGWPLLSPPGTFENNSDWVRPRDGAVYVDTMAVRPFNPNLLVTLEMVSRNCSPDGLFDLLASEFRRLAFRMTTSEYQLDYMADVAWIDGERVYEHSRGFIDGIDAFWWGPSGPNFADGAYNTATIGTPEESASTCPSPHQVLVQNYASESDDKEYTQPDDEEYKVPF